MPDYFTHEIAAEIIYRRLGLKLGKEDTDLYLLGAQGGDLFFTYTLSLNSNTGSLLHSMDNVRLFKALARANGAYAAGFATHYALDSTMHPVIYALEARTSAPFAHILLEADIGLFTSKKYGIGRRILPRERVMKCADGVYAAVRGVLGDITPFGVQRCLARHYAYTRAALFARKSRYTFGFDYSPIFPVMERAISLGCDCVSAISSGDISPSLFGASFLAR